MFPNFMNTVFMCPNLRPVQGFKLCPFETNGSVIPFSDTISKHILFSEDFFVLPLRGKIHLQRFPLEQSIKSLKQIHLHFHLHFRH